MTRTGSLLGAATLFFLLAAPVERVFPQQDYGNRLGYNRGGQVAFRPQGPWVDTGALDLAVKKRYLPQELYQEYRWKTWEYTNYARRPYLRYVDLFTRGDYFYDFYGNFLTKGWLIYDWTEERPRTSEGSRILQRPEYARHLRQPRNSFRPERAVRLFHHYRRRDFHHLDADDFPQSCL